MGSMHALAIRGIFAVSMVRHPSTSHFMSALDIRLASCFCSRVCGVFSPNETCRKKLPARRVVSHQAPEKMPFQVAEKIKIMHPNPWHSSTALDRLPGMSALPPIGLGASRSTFEELE